VKNISSVAGKINLAGTLLFRLVARWGKPYVVLGGKGLGKGGYPKRGNLGNLHFNMETSLGRLNARGEIRYQNKEKLSENQLG